jgi:hypothetical protein
VPKLAYDPETGEIEWKKSDLTFPGYALPYLLRRKMSEEEIAALRQEARAYSAKAASPSARGSEKEFHSMLRLDLPNGTHMDFENAEALELALQRMREGKPIVVRDQKDGGPEVLWAPEDDVDARGHVRIPVPPRGH